MPTLCVHSCALPTQVIEVKEKLGLDVRDETITAKVLADMVPIDGTEEQKISALHEKLMSGGVSDEDLQALREQAQAATKIQVGLPSGAAGGQLCSNGCPYSYSEHLTRPSHPHTRLHLLHRPSIPSPNDPPPSRTPTYTLHRHRRR